MAKAEDKPTLLKIAEAWEQQAKLAELASSRNSDGKPDGAGSGR
jgi:hypothetical protein